MGGGNGSGTDSIGAGGGAAEMTEAQRKKLAYARELQEQVQ